MRRPPCNLRPSRGLIRDHPLVPTLTFQLECEGESGKAPRRRQLHQQQKCFSKTALHSLRTLLLYDRRTCGRPLSALGTLIRRAARLQDDSSRTMGRLPARRFSTCAFWVAGFETARSYTGVYIHPLTLQGKSFIPPKGFLVCACVCVF